MVDIAGMGKLYYLKIQTHLFCVQVEVTTALFRHIRTLELSGINKAGSQ